MYNITCLVCKIPLSHYLLHKLYYIIKPITSINS